MGRLTREQLLEMVIQQAKLRTADLKFVLRSAEAELARRDARAVALSAHGKAEEKEATP